MSSGDWGKPSRVLGYKSIDLGKSSNFKDPGFIKSFAEQMTLFKYSCYSAITRRYCTYSSNKLNYNIHTPMHATGIYIYSIIIIHNCIN